MTSGASEPVRISEGTISPLEEEYHIQPFWEVGWDTNRAYAL